MDINNSIMKQEEIKIQWEHIYDIDEDGLPRARVKISKYGTNINHPNKEEGHYMNE